MNAKQHGSSHGIPKEHWEEMKGELGINLDDKDPKSRYSFWDVVDEDLKLLSHKEVREIMNDEERFEQFKASFPVLTSTGIAYPAYGKPFGNMLIHDDLHVAVPAECQGVKDIAIVFPELKVHYHPESGVKSVIGRYYVLRDFVPIVDYYKVDREFGIPYGPQSSETDGLLLLPSDKGYVGPVVAGGIACSIDEGGGSVSTLERNLVNVGIDLNAREFGVIFRT